MINQYFLSHIFVRMGLDEKKKTLKADEHDKCENIAGSVSLSLFIGRNGNAYYQNHTFVYHTIVWDGSKLYRLLV
jgi:hypothetical protein